MPSIRSLRIFREVCHTGNLTRAAENLFMTQPAVSQTIKELEKSTGLNLFDRLSHRLVLTPTGEIYLEKVLHLLAVYDDLADSPGQVRQ